MRHWRVDSRTMARTVWQAAILAALGLATVEPAAALECPVPQPLTRPGILKETKAQTRMVSNLLATGDTGNRVGVIVSDLRARYPGVENTEIVNYLMAAYCPLVAQLTGLGEREKQARMDRFTNQMMRIVE